MRASFMSVSSVGQAVQRGGTAIADGMTPAARASWSRGDISAGSASRLLIVGRIMRPPGGIGAEGHSVRIGLMTYMKICFIHKSTHVEFRL